jgi:Right handed beta helix region
MLVACASESVTRVSGTISQDTLWAASACPMLVTGDLRVEGAAGPHLIIEAGCELRFAPGATLVVGEAAPGGLVMVGSEQHPVTLGAEHSALESTMPGAWTGITIGAQFLSATSEIGNAIIRNAGGGDRNASILVQKSGTALHDVSIVDGKGVPVVLDEGVTLAGKVSNVVAANEGDVESAERLDEAILNPADDEVTLSDPFDSDDSGEGSFAQNADGEVPCSSIEPGQVVKVRASMTLEAGCTLRRVSFEIKESDVVLDLNGALMHGLDKDEANAYGKAYPEGGVPTENAFVIFQNNDDATLTNITVKNASTKNYVMGAAIRRKYGQDTIDKLRDTENLTGSTAQDFEDELRRLAPHGIRFENVNFDYSHKNGMYINRYVTDVTYTGGAITNSGNSGIYLESGTQRMEITHSTFTRNGYYEWDSKTRKRTAKDTFNFGREAIAVDSSAYNHIAYNTFRDNKAGSVYLYKNCWENHEAKHQAPRRQHSNDNVIENNRMIDELVGVWIASRASSSRKSSKCGDPVVYSTSSFWGKVQTRFYRDYAERTTVANNTFEDVTSGVMVEDDDAVIDGNTFKGGLANIVVGSLIRGLKVKNGVRNTRVTNNTFDSDKGDPIHVSFASRDGVYEGNKKGKKEARASCPLHFYIPAQDDPTKSCRMESTKWFKLIDPFSRKDGTKESFEDTTKKGTKEGVWGKGDFVCENGAWRMLKGNCCYGKNCK